MTSATPSFRLGDERAHACFYIVRGDADVTLDRRTHAVGRGAFGYLPCGFEATVASRGDELQFVTWTTFPD